VLIFYALRKKMETKHPAKAMEATNIMEDTAIIFRFTPYFMKNNESFSKINKINF
jgi:hypothetical protein